MVVAAEVRRALQPAISALVDAVSRMERIQQPSASSAAVDRTVQNKIDGDVFTRSVPMARRRAQPATAPAASDTSLLEPPAFSALLPSGALDVALPLPCGNNYQQHSMLESELLEAALRSSMPPRRPSPPPLDDELVTTLRHIPNDDDDESGQQQVEDDASTSTTNDSDADVDLRQPSIASFAALDTNNDGPWPSFPASAPLPLTSTGSHRSSRTQQRIAELHTQLAQEVIVGSFANRPSTAPAALKLLTVPSTRDDNIPDLAPEVGRRLSSSLRVLRVRYAIARIFEGAAERATLPALRAAGMLPWCTERYPLASIAYQFVSAAALFASALQRAVSLAQSGTSGEGAGAGAAVVGGIVMPLGAAFAIIACISPSAGSLGDLMAMLHAHAHTRGYEVHARTMATREAWISGILGVLACAIYAYYHSSNAVKDNINNGGVISSVVFAACIASNLLLAALAAAQLSIGQYLDCMVDHFCCSLMDETDFDQAVREWNVVQAILRLACRTVQSSFVVLQVCALAIVISSAMDASVNGLHGKLPWGAMTTTLLAVRLLASATSITDKCMRVPAFVNSLGPDIALDQARLYLVHYVVYSNAGFYTYGVRLHSGLVLRLFYAGCAIVFGAATRLLSSHIGGN